MSANRDAKVLEVAEIKDKLSRASSVVLVEYIGMNVLEVTELRNQLRKAKVDYKVLKNTLVKRAADELEIQGLDPFLTGSTAVAFSYEDPTASAKVFTEQMKKVQKLKIKGGLVGKKAISAASVEELSKVPAKEVLVAKLLGTMNAPITNFVSVLNGPARALVCALNAIKDQKAQQSA